MDMTQYTNRPDWTTELKLHNGKVEHIKHCGRCLAIIPREVCEHCDGTMEKVRRDELTKLEGGEPATE